MYAHLVDLEKCCQTHIFLQIFVSIQPRTSPVKFARSSRFPESEAQVRGGGACRRRAPGLGAQPHGRGGARGPGGSAAGWEACSNEKK